MQITHFIRLFAYNALPKMKNTLAKQLNLVYTAYNKPREGYFYD